MPEAAPPGTPPLLLLRTAAYRLASPAEALWRALTGRSPLPPLWLRRHTGPPRAFEGSAAAMAAMLDGLDLVRPADTVLDIGCGPGAMVPGLLRRLGPSGRYVGFDVHEASISWCRNRWADDARLRFELAPIATPYGPTAGSGAETYRFPVSDGAADLVLAKSVFTHLPEEPARHYLAEVRRTLRPGRAAVVTAFLFDAAGPALPLVRTGFPHEGHAGLVRWRRRTRPTAAIAYDRSLFSEMTAAAGLRIIWMSPGFFPGASRPAGQDVLLLGI